MFKHIDTVIIRVPDEMEAAGWYGAALGLGEGRHDPQSRTVTFALDGPTSLTLWAGADDDQSPGGAGRSYPIFYAADALEAHRRLMQHGVRVGEIGGDDGFRWFRFWDPYGTVLEACSY
jgi:catechol 2,3-dioxygenase-like lactoylglutathione lyase family enzyme